MLLVWYGDYLLGVWLLPTGGVASNVTTVVWVYLLGVWLLPIGGVASNVTCVVWWLPTGT